MSGRLYVGNLPSDVKPEEIGKLFERFGAIRAMDIKVSRDGAGPAYAFVEFEDQRDADAAARDRDGTDFGGARLRVELAKGGYVSTSSRGPPRRSAFRVRVVGLPQSASWQDLKDFMRSAGDVGYSNVERGRDGVVGVVEYSNAEDTERAIRKLDRTEFRNRYDSAVVRVEEDAPSSGGGGGYGGGGAGGGYGGGGGYRDEPPRGGGSGYDRGYDRGYGGGGGDRYAGGGGGDRYAGGGGGGGYRDEPRGGGFRRDRSRSRERYGGGGRDERGPASRDAPPRDGGYRDHRDEPRGGGSSNGGGRGREERGGRDFSPRDEPPRREHHAGAAGAAPAGGRDYPPGPGGGAGERPSEGGAPY